MAQQADATFVVDAVVQNVSSIEQLNRLVADVKGQTEGLSKTMKGVGQSLKGLDQLSKLLQRGFRDSVAKNLTPTSTETEALKVYTDQVRRLFKEAVQGGVTENVKSLRSELQKVNDTLKEQAANARAAQQAMASIRSANIGGQAKAMSGDQLQRELTMAREAKALAAAKISDVNTEASVRQKLEAQLARSYQWEKAITKEIADRSKIKPPVTPEQKAAAGWEMTHERLNFRGGAELLKVQATLALNYKLLSSVTGAFTAAGQEVVSFDKALRELQAVSGTSEGSMVALRKTIEQTSMATRFSATEVTEAAKTLAQAGFTMAEISKALPGVLTLATATGTDVKTATDVATSALGVFKMRADEMPHVADMMTRALNDTKLSMEQLALGIQYAANGAADAGMSFTEMTAIMAGMANAGIRSGSTIGTGFRQMLIEFMDPSDKLKAKLSQLGMGLDQLNVKVYGGTGVLTNLAKAGFTSADAFATMDTRSAAAFSAISRNLPFIQGMTDQLLMATGAAEANDIQMKSLANSATQFGNSLGVVASTALKDVVASLAAMFRSLSEGLKALNEFEGGLRLVANGLSALALAGAAWKIGSLVKGLFEARAAAKLAAAEMAAAASATTATGAAAAGAAAGVGVFSRAIGFLGGPVGAIATVLGAGAWAYLEFGNAATKSADAVDKAKQKFEEAKNKSDELKSAYESNSGEINRLNDRLSGFTGKAENAGAETDALQKMVLEATNRFGALGFTFDATKIKTQDITKSVYDFKGALQQLADSMQQDYASSLAGQMDALSDKIIATKNNIVDLASQAKRGLTQSNWFGLDVWNNVDRYRKADMSATNPVTQKSETLVSQLSAPGGLQNVQLQDVQKNVADLTKLAREGEDELLREVAGYWKKTITDILSKLKEAKGDELRQGFLKDVQREQEFLKSAVGEQLKRLKEDLVQFNTEFSKMAADAKSESQKDEIIKGVNDEHITLVNKYDNLIKSLSPDDKAKFQVSTLGIDLKNLMGQFSTSVEEMAKRLNKLAIDTLQAQISEIDAQADLAKLQGGEGAITKVAQLSSKKVEMEADLAIKKLKEDKDTKNLKDADPEYTRRLKLINDTRDAKIASISEKARQDNIKQEIEKTNEEAAEYKAVWTNNKNKKGDAARARAARDKMKDLAIKRANLEADMKNLSDSRRQQLVRDAEVAWKEELDAMERNRSGGREKRVTQPGEEFEWERRDRFPKQMETMLKDAETAFKKVFTELNNKLSAIAADIASFDNPFSREGGSPGGRYALERRQFEMQQQVDDRKAAELPTIIDKYKTVNDEAVRRYDEANQKLEEQKKKLEQLRDTKKLTAEQERTGLAEVGRLSQIVDNADQKRAETSQRLLDLEQELEDTRNRIASRSIERAGTLGEEISNNVNKFLSEAKGATKFTAIAGEMAYEGLKAANQGLAQGLRDVAKGAKTAGEALKDMAYGFLDAMLQVASNRAAAGLIDAVLGGVGFGAAGGDMEVGGGTRQGSRKGGGSAQSGLLSGLGGLIGGLFSSSSPTAAQQSQPVFQAAVADGVTEGLKSSPVAAGLGSIGKVLLGNGGSGSGVLTGTDGTFLTAAHVANGLLGQSLNIDIGGSVRKALVEDINWGSDLAKLKLFDTSGLTPAKIAGGLNVGDALTSYGFPAGGALASATGNVQSLAGSTSWWGKQFTGQTQWSGMTSPGMSGGPVFNQAGELVGLNSSSMGAGGSFSVGLDKIQTAVAGGFNNVDTSSISQLGQQTFQQSMQPGGDIYKSVSGYYDGLQQTVAGGVPAGQTGNAGGAGGAAGGGGFGWGGAMVGAGIGASLGALIAGKKNKLLGSVLGALAGGLAGGFLFNEGGLVGTDGRSVPVLRFATGGPIPGVDLGRDSVPMLGRVGEFVVNRRAVDAVGTDFMHKLNSDPMGALQQNGGAPLYQPPAAAPPVNTNVWVVSPDQQPSMGPNDVIATISRDIMTGGPIKKLIKTVSTG